MGREAVRCADCANTKELQTVKEGDPPVVLCTVSNVGKVANRMRGCKYFTRKEKGG